MQRYRWIYVVMDLIMTTVAVLLYGVLRYYIDPQAWGTHHTLIIYMSNPVVVTEQIFFPLLMLGIYWLSGYYNRVFLKSRSDDFFITFASSLSGTAIFFLIALINNDGSDRIVAYMRIVYLMVLMFAMVYCGRAAVTAYIRRQVYRGHWRRTALVVGRGPDAARLAERLDKESPWNGMKLLGCVAPEDVAGTIGTLGPIEIFVVVPEINNPREILEILCQVFPLGADVFTSPNLHSMLTSRMQVDKIAGEPLVNISHASASESTVNIKRLGDVLFGTLGLIISLPVICILALAIRCESPGRVIFSQKRVGKNKRIFTMYKLRSMFEAAEETIPQLSTPGDRRITRIGRLMRKYRLDELPQFWNVIKGDMSLVGPRPERPYFIEKILVDAPYYTLLQCVRPGITSLGMVKFGYASDVGAMIERMRFDLMYIDNISLSTDFKILIYTVKTIFTGKGI